MRKGTFLRLGGLAALAVAALGVSATPASANNGSICGGNYSGYFCFYDSYGYANKLKQAYYCGSYDLPSGTWDRTTSYADHQYADSSGFPVVTVVSWKVAPDFEYLWGDQNTSTTEAEMSYVGSSVDNKADHYYNYC